MSTLMVSLPEALHEFLDERVKSCGYGSVSEYIQELIRNDQKQTAEAKLEALLLEGLDSGDPMEVTAEFWQELHAELQPRAKPA